MSPQIEKQQFRNETDGYIGAVVIGPKGEERGIAVEPGGTVWLSEQEQVLTANAPRRPEDNPFVEWTMERFNAEKGENEATQVTPLIPISEARYVPAGDRFIPGDVTNARATAAAQAAVTGEEPSTVTAKGTTPAERTEQVEALGEDVKPGAVLPATEEEQAASDARLGIGDLELPPQQFPNPAAVAQETPVATSVPVTPEQAAEAAGEEPPEVPTDHVEPPPAEQPVPPEPVSPPPDTPGEPVEPQTPSEEPAPPVEPSSPGDAGPPAPEQPPAEVPPDPSPPVEPPPPDSGVEPDTPVPSEPTPEPVPPVEEQPTAPDPAAEPPVEPAPPVEEPVPPVEPPSEPVVPAEPPAGDPTPPAPDAPAEPPTGEPPAEPDGEPTLEQPIEPAPDETAAASPGPESEETGAAVEPTAPAPEGEFAPGEEVATPDAPQSGATEIPPPWNPEG